MEKPLVILIIVIFLLTVGLMGCEDYTVPESNDTSELYIRYLKIQTVRTYYDINNNIREEVLFEDRKNFTYDPIMDYYKVSGQIDSGYEETLGRVVLEANFYDENEILLLTQKQSFFDVKDVEVPLRNFIFRFDDVENFTIVDSVELSFSVFDY